MSNTQSKKKAQKTGKKKILGVHNDGTDLKAILASLSGDKIVIEHMDSSKLLSPLKQIEEISGGESKEEDLEDMTAEDIFGLKEGEKSEEEAENPFEGEEVSDGEAGETPVSNEDIVLSLLQRAPVNKYHLAITLPPPIMNTVVLKNGYSKLKPKERERKINTEIGDKLHGAVPKDHYAYIEAERDRLLAFGYIGDIPLIQIYDSIHDRLGQKHKFLAINPNELSVINLVNYNYQPKEVEVIVIIDIMQDESRIIVTKGGKFVHMAPIIREGASSSSVLNTIKGKFLYETDLGRIPDYDLLVLTGKSKQLKAKEFFQENLNIETIEYVRLNSERFAITPEDALALQNFTGALGLAVTALKEGDSNIYTVNLIPEYVQKRQQVFKIAWHGFIILLLIMFVPLLFNWQHNKKKFLMHSYEQEVEFLEKSIDELKWVKPLVDSLTFELADLNAKYAKLDSLSRGTRRARATITKIYFAARDASGLWLTDMDVQSNSIEINGFSIYRNRISRFIRSFPDASIESVVPTEIRDETVYQFKVIIDRVVDDPSEYNPDVE